MDEFSGILSRDFGLRPQGLAAPMMSASKRGAGAFGSASGLGSGAAASAFPGDLLGGDHRGSSRRDEAEDVFFGAGGAAPPKYASAGGGAAFASDPFFSMGAAKTGPSPPVEAGLSSSMPVFDKPVYDDDDGDIFSGVPGMKKSSVASAGAHGDVFAPTPAHEDDLLASLGGSRPGSRGSGDSGRPRPASGNASPPYGDDDLLASFGRSGGVKGSESASNPASPPYDDDLLAGLGGGGSFGDGKRSGAPPSYGDDLLAGLGGAPKHSSGESRSREQGISAFDDLIPGFGGSSPPKQKSGQSEGKHQQSSVSSTKSTVTMAEDPFVVLESTSSTAYSSLGSFTNPLERISKPSGSMKSDVSSAKVGGLFDDINGFDGFVKSMPSFSSEIKDNKERSTLENSGKGSAREPSIKPTDNIFPMTVPDDRSHQTLFEKPSKSSEVFKSVHGNGLNLDANDNPYDGINTKQKPEEQPMLDDDVWLTVSEIHLFTQLTSAPPPSRPPPAFRSKQALFTSQGEGSSVSLNATRKVTESSFPQPTGSYIFQNSRNETPKQSAVSSFDELEEFAMGKPPAYVDEAQSGEEENEANSTAAASAAAMKEAMDRAEAKFKHAREVRERERDLKSFKNRETAQRDEDEKEKERQDREREQREREEKEQRRFEKMRELELEREREKARQAVERATREARERAAAEARQKAEKVAREHAERAAVHRAQAEARERAAAEAKERAERLAAERERAEAEARERAARERAAERERAEAEGRERVAAEARERAARERAREKAGMEAREKAERAAVERAAAEARARAQRAAVERATAEARERAAALAREKQQKNANDLNPFFGMGARANSVPRERATPSESAFDAQFQNKGNPEGNRKTSSVSSSNMKRPSSTTNIMDDLTSVFGTSSNGEFQEIEGEPEERRRARLEREQRARERAAKALAEKNEREMQMQREQAERDRIADTLNIEIRRWAAGKEGNLRALLSTLQYVLWPDSGWQPVSLTDLITAASVKKVYRKATLCVHPDKVVNGTVQQKYIAEKVFDLLKESWNKFNSEELF